MAFTWVAVGEFRVGSATPSGGLASLGTATNLPPLIPGEVRQAALTPQLLPAPQLVEGRLQAAFNAIPGRTYLVEASSTLGPNDWSPLGTVTATDFQAGFALPVDAADSHCFFRVSTP